jgi:type VI secretion system protein ImpA
MATIDVDSLLTEISADAPAGPSLEYDPRYMQLKQDAVGEPPRYTPDGRIESEGTPPNYKAIRSAALDLCAETRDLDLVLLLVSTMVATDGFPGLRDGLVLVRGLMEQHWDHFHPQLDPDDDNDPLMRMNLLAAFAAPPGADGDVMQFQDRVRRAPLCESRQLGRFNLRDVKMAKGEIAPAAGAAAPDPALIDGAFNDTDPDALAAIGEAVHEAVDSFDALDKWVTEKVGAGNAPNLASFSTLLKEVKAVVSEQLAKRGMGDAIAPEAGESAAVGAPGAAGNAPAPISGVITSPDDVRTALQKIIDYYAISEPSSPVPLILQRAKRLISANYIDIIKDMTPDAAHQIKTITGVDPYEES